MGDGSWILASLLHYLPTYVIRLPNSHALLFSLGGPIELSMVLFSSQLDVKNYVFGLESLADKSR